MIPYASRPVKQRVAILSAYSRVYLKCILSQHDWNRYSALNYRLASYISNLSA